MAFLRVCRLWPGPEIRSSKSEIQKKPEARDPNERYRTDAFSAHFCASPASGFRTSVFGLLSGFEDSDFGIRGGVRLGDLPTRQSLLQIPPKKVSAFVPPLWLDVRIEATQRARRVAVLAGGCDRTAFSSLLEMQTGL